MQATHQHLVGALRGTLLDSGMEDFSRLSVLVGRTSKHCVGPMLTLRSASAAYDQLHPHAAVETGRPQVYVGLSGGALALSATLACPRPGPASAPGEPEEPRAAAGRKRGREALDEPQATQGQRAERGEQAEEQAEELRLANRGEPPQKAQKVTRTLLQRMLSPFLGRYKAPPAERWRTAHPAAAQAVEAAAAVARASSPPIEIPAQALAAALAVVDRLYGLRADGLPAVQRVAVSVNQDGAIQPVHASMSGLAARRPVMFVVARLAVGVPLLLDDLLRAVRPAEWSGVVDGYLTTRALPSSFCQIPPNPFEEAVHASTGGQGGLLLMVGLGGR